MIVLSTAKSRPKETSCAVAIFISILLFGACSGSDPKFSQYYAQGEVLYEKNCSNCHQKNGTGLGLLYPPLAASDYLDKNLNNTFCLMKYGIRGELQVNGKSFNKPMPGVPSLTELEIAEIATYISNSWNGARGIVNIQDVKLAMEKCQPQ